MAKRKTDLALLMLRAILGVVFVAHGSQKLFGWFGGGGFTAEVAQMRSLGLEPATMMAFLAGSSELGGGLLLLLGLLTPVGAVAITGVMVVATATTTGPNGFFIQDGGYEYNLVLIAVCAALGLAGAGRYSVDRVLSARPVPRLVRTALRQPT